MSPVNGKPPLGMTPTQYSAVEETRQVPTYQPLPSATCTRVITIDRVNHHGQYKLHLRLSIIDLDLVKGPTEYCFLGILPGEKPDQVISYEDEFDALSYTWGAPLSTPECEAEYGPASDVDVLISSDEGSTFSHKIGRNLYEALAHLTTRPEVKRRLWVDAVCINQKDLPEKEEHILLMSMIYHKAHNVFVWLGRDILDSEDVKHLLWFHNVALELAARYGQWPTHNDFILSGEQDGMYVTTMDNFLLPGETLRALYRFYGQRRYFRRAWTIQEVSLAHRCGVILGNHVLHIESLVWARSFIRDLGGIAALFSSNDTAYDEGAELENLVRNMAQFQDLKARKGVIVDKVCPYNDLCDDRQYDLAMLEYQLSNGMIREASDPKDIIYCLLGWAQAIVPLEDPPVKPDYTATTQHVYISATIAFLQWSPHCSIIGLVVEKPEHAEYVKHLPSWVPDYATCQGGSGTFRRHIDDVDEDVPPFCASKGDECNARLSITDLRLSVSARYVSKMRLCMDLPHSISLDGGSTWQREFEMVEREAGVLITVLEACLRLVQGNSSGLVEEFMRVLCFGGFEFPNAVDFRLLCRLHISTMHFMLRQLLRYGRQTSQLSHRLDELCDQMVLLPMVPDQTFRQAHQLLLYLMPAWNKRSSLPQAQILDSIQTWRTSWAPLADEFVGSSYVFPSSDTAGIGEAIRQMDDFIKFILGRRLPFVIGLKQTIFITEKNNIRTIGKCTSSRR